MVRPIKNPLNMYQSSLREVARNDNMSQVIDGEIYELGREITQFTRSGRQWENTVSTDGEMEMCYIVVK